MSTNIKSISFGILSTEEIRKLSVAQITAHDVYEKGIPKYGGLSDLRLGTIDRQFRCHTCKHDALGCAGHFGHIELAKPVFHISYNKTLVKVLQTICPQCSRIKCEIEKRLTNNAKQFKYVYEQSTGKLRCNHCVASQPKIQYDKGDIYFEWPLAENGQGGKTQVSADTVLKILTNIPMDQIKLLGFDEKNKPENMIIQAVIVPPPHVRPSVSMDSSLKSQDDLTHKLCEIVKTNNALHKALATDENNRGAKALEELLQYHVTTYIDNGIPGINQATQRTGRPIKAICQRLKSKEGRIRGNLMGKRVNFSARTVITAEPSIDLDELGVPWIIAKTLSM